jgi:hypothetical protein
MKNINSLSQRSLVRAGAAGAVLPLAGYSFDRDGSQRDSESDDGSYGCRYLSTEGEVGAGHLTTVLQNCTVVPTSSSTARS